MNYLAVVALCGAGTAPSAVSRLGVGVEAVLPAWTAPARSGGQATAAAKERR